MLSAVSGVSQAESSQRSNNCDQQKERSQHPLQISGLVKHTVRTQNKQNNRLCTQALPLHRSLLVLFSFLLPPPSSRTVFLSFLTLSLSLCCSVFRNQEATLVSAVSNSGCLCLCEFVSDADFLVFCLRRRPLHSHYPSSLFLCPFLFRNSLLGLSIPLSPYSLIPFFTPFLTSFLFSLSTQCTGDNGRASLLQ